MQMTVGKALLGAVFIVAGVLHFVIPQFYIRIVPPLLPDPVLIVQVSGVCEILGGIGVLVPATQRFAAWGLMALLIAVFPANIYMMVDHARFATTPLWAAWARLPLQLPLIYWAWIYTRG